MNSEILTIPVDEYPKLIKELQEEVERYKNLYNYSKKEVEELKERVKKLEYRESELEYILHGYREDHLPYYYEGKEIK